jgi:hypothetical protein
MLPLPVVLVPISVGTLAIQHWNRTQERLEARLGALWCAPLCAVIGASSGSMRADCDAQGHDAKATTQA